MMPFHHRVLSFIGRVTKTVIIIPHPISIGNYAEEIYFGLLKARREGKKLLILQPYQLPGYLRLKLHNNRELLELQSPFRSKFQDNPLCIVACWFVTLFFGFFRAISIIMQKFLNIKLHELYIIPMMGQDTLWQPLGGLSHFSWDVVEKLRWDEQFQTPIELNLAPHQLANAKTMREKMGLPNNAWFVCLHVRDGAYYGDHQQASTRNANIMNYLDAIQEVTNRGGWVVRMGDSGMPRLPQIKQVIDYPFLPEKCALMDIYLIKECKIYIGMASGILDVAMLFQRPTIVTNLPTWLLAYPLKKNDLGIFKHVYSKKERRYISPFEWPFIPWGGHSNFFPAEEYEFRENTSFELSKLVSTYFERVFDCGENENQIRFKKIRNEGGRLLLSKEMILNDLRADVAARYRLASRLESAAGTLTADLFSSSIDGECM